MPAEDPPIAQKAIPIRAQRGACRCISQAAAKLPKALANTTIEPQIAAPATLRPCVSIRKVAPGRDGEPLQRVEGEGEAEEPERGLNQRLSYAGPIERLGVEGEPLVQELAGGGFLEGI